MNHIRKQNDGSPRTSSSRHGLHGPGPTGRPSVTLRTSCQACLTGRTARSLSQNRYYNTQAVLGLCMINYYHRSLTMRPSNCQHSHFSRVTRDVLWGIAWKIQNRMTTSALFLFRTATGGSAAPLIGRVKVYRKLGFSGPRHRLGASQTSLGLCWAVQACDMDCKCRLAAA